MQKRLFSSLILLLVITVVMYGQSKEEIAVTKAVEQLKQAMIDGKGPALEALVMDELSYGHSGGKIETKKEFVEGIVSGSSDFVTIDLTEQTVLVSGTTAVVRHVLTAETNDNGKPGSVHLGILLIWQNKGEGWKLLARQAVKKI